MSTFLKVVCAAALKEAAKVLAENDGRAVAVALAESLFDKYVVPIDVPGPDSAVEPMIRKMIAPVVGAIYDKAISGITAAA